MQSLRRPFQSLLSVLALALALLLWHNVPPCLSHANEPSADKPPSAASPKPPEPAPQLTPEGVIQCQVRELSADGDVGERIARCYRFASPDNKKYTGPLERFSKMVKSPPYDALLGAKHFLVGRATRDKDQAHLLLSVVNQQNEMVLFRCFLSKQTDAEFKDCWMTDAVVPIVQTQRPKAAKAPQPSSI